jgi:hypothetical protein
MKSTEAEAPTRSEAKVIDGNGRVRIERHGRYWAVYDGEALVCMTVYLKGAREVVRRLKQEI